MAIRTYKVTLDSKNSIAPEPVFLRQGDKTGAVVIDATLMDNSSPVSLSGLTPMFKANTADGQAVIADSTGFNIINDSGGEFTYQVPNALSSVPGKITTAYFSFSDTSGSESTFDVAFIIKKAVDITKPQANDYITIIDGTLQSLQQKIDSMNTDIQTIINTYNQGDFYNKTETDSKDAATLASAKNYADNGDSATLASAKSYVDKDNYYTKAEIDKALQGTFIAYPGISGYAGDVKVLVVGNKATAWLFGKIPKNVGTQICYLPKNIIPKTDYYKTLLFRTIPSQSLVLKINSADGALEVVANTNDIDMLADEFTWTIGEVYA